MKKRKSSIKKLKRKKKRRSSEKLHKVFPTLKLVEDKKPKKKEIKTISEQSQDKLEPIISTPIKIVLRRMSNKNKLKKIH